MINTIELPIVPNSVGTAIALNSLAGAKTIIASGVLGVVSVEASGDGVTWIPVLMFTPPDDAVSKPVYVSCLYMRVNCTSGLATSVYVMAESGLIRTASIPVPPSDGPGSSVDTSYFGPVASFFCSFLAGVVDIEVSGDGSHWSTLLSLTRPEVITTGVSAKYMRAVGRGASAAITACSEDVAVTSSPVSNYVFRPGDPEGSRGNVYVDFSSLYNALQSTSNLGQRRLEFDCTYAPLVDIPAFGGLNPACVIPAGSWDMKDVVWTSNTDPTNVALVVLATDCRIFRLTKMDATLLVVLNDSETSVPISLDFDIGPFGQNTEGINIVGTGCRLGVTKSTAKPLLTCNPVYSYVEFNTTSGMLGVGEDFGVSDSEAPVVDLNDGVFYQYGGCTAKNIITDSSLAATGIFYAWALTNEAMQNIAGNQDFSFVGCPVTVSFIWQVVVRDVRKVVNTAIDYSSFCGDTVLADSTSGPITIFLPTAVRPRGLSITVKDSGGNGGVNNITLTAQGGQNIEGVVSKALTSNYGFVEVMCDGAGNWYVVGGSAT